MRLVNSRCSLVADEEICLCVGVCVCSLIPSICWLLAPACVFVCVCMCSCWRPDITVYVDAAADDDDDDSVRLKSEIRVVFPDSPHTHTYTHTHHTHTALSHNSFVTRAPDQYLHRHTVAHWSSPTSKTALRRVLATLALFLTARMRFYAVSVCVCFWMCISVTDGRTSVLWFATMPNSVTSLKSTIIFNQKHISNVATCNWFPSTFRLFTHNQYVYIIQVLYIFDSLNFTSCK